MGKIELLAPAKDASTGIAAINCGADAVYIGASSFGARNAAANSVDDIKKLIAHAHLYYAKVYAALNTLLFDDEIEAAQKLAFSLCEAGIDGLIIQDMGLFEAGLPPVPLIASTQMHNNTAEKVKFLEDIGFSRVILARELTLDQIKDIRSKTSIELECFIHGALCVSQSGQCYMSYAAGGRSGNRGMCAQPCRKLYQLTDESGHQIGNERYYLSLKDLNLSNSIEELLDVGISSFKIEGRLKNIPYVANITAHYRTVLDNLLPKRNLNAASSGKVKLDFTPDPLKTFNRSYTDYGLHSNNGKYGSIDTPKSLGEPVGSISNVSGNYFELQESDSELHNGDGICFFDGGNSLQGTVINKVEGGRIYPQKMEYLQPGILIYRNYDHLFTKKLENTAAGRKIGLSLIFTETPDGVKLTGIDEDGNTASIETPAQKEPAKNPELAHNNIKKQLGKLGETIFESTDIKIELERAYFFTAAFLNSLRRELADKMLRARLKARSIPHRAKAANPGASYPEKELTFMGNVLNEKARDFYLARGVEKIEPAAESGIDIRGRQVMTTKYCLRRQIGLCEGAGKDTTVPPLYITDDYNNSYKLTFTCRDCGMKIFLRDKG